jgi:hypothetical protein
MNITEWITHFDASTLDEIPETAEWMGESEAMHMWAYPEPDYAIASDGTTMTLPAWYIETSIGRWGRTTGGSIFMGASAYNYTIDNDNQEEGK